MQRFGAIGGRGWIGFVLMGACALHAEAVRAQDTHHLLASAGNQFHSDSEENLLDGRAEFVWQDGVQGTNPSFFIHQAVADGDSGVLSIFSRFSLAGGAGDPIIVLGNNRSVAVIEETIDPGTATSGTVTVTARLDWDGSGSLANGGGNVDTGKVSAYLTVDQCSVGFTKDFSSIPTQSGDGTECVPSATNFGSAGAGALTVTTIRDAAGIGSGSRFFVTAQIEGEAGTLSGLEYFDSGEYAASGQLSIEVSGAPFTYASPTFLTVPEPADAALAATALAALLTLARRRR